MLPSYAPAPLHALRGPCLDRAQRVAARVRSLPALRAGESWRVKRKCMTKGERESPREPWVKEGQEGGDRGSDRGALGQELDAMRPVKLVMLMGGSCHLAASCHPAGRVAWLGCRTRRMLGAPTLSPPSCWSRGAWTVGALVDRRPRRSVGLLGLGGMKGSRPPRCPESACCGRGGEEEDRGVVDRGILLSTPALLPG